jgi:starch-binding outer membrane protein SusE/F
MEYEPEVEAPLYVKVESRLSNFSTLMSDPLTVSVTPYSSLLDLTTPWGVVGSAYNNWGAFPDAPFFQSTTSSSTIVAYVELMDGFIKFRQNNAWDTNFGDNGNDGTLEQNGSDIPVEAGRYKISWNTANNSYTIEQFSWGIVGSAYNDWGAGGPDFPFTYDDATDQWRAVVALKDGAFKIRKNNDWGLNYGDNGADGTLEEGGADMNITAGKYMLTFNDKDLTLTIEAIPNIWGLVGSAYNDWGGAGPDAQFQPDWRNEGVWILRNVTLLDGAFKFRDNNDWGLNYGDTGADGSLEENGTDITSQAGIYTITLDFTNPSSPTWSSVKH